MASSPSIAVTVAMRLACRQASAMPANAASTSASRVQFRAPARSKGTNIIIARFAKATCQPCPARARCTTAVRSGRQPGFRHRRIHEALTAARAGQAGDAWQHRYRIRAGVEGTIAQATHVTGIRRAATSAWAKPGWNTTPQPPST